MDQRCALSSVSISHSVQRVQLVVLSQSASARALIGAGVLASHFPDADIRVCVFEGSADAPLLNFAREVLSEWKLGRLDDIFIEYIDGQTSFLESIDHLILEPELVAIAKKFAKHSKIHVATITSDSWRKSFEKIEGSSINLARVHLAKIVGEYIKIVAKIRPEDGRQKINAFIPLREEDCDLAYASAQFESSLNNGVVLDVDFRAKKNHGTETFSQVVTFDPKLFDVSSFLNLHSGTLISPSRELSFPESALISKRWVDAVLQMAMAYPVNLVTAPRFIRNRKIPDSYLSVGIADHLVRIGV